MNIQENSEHSIDFCMLDYPCSYLPEKNTRMFYRYMRHADKKLVSELIRRGWRRFGCYFFHPICAGCNGCKSLRVNAEAFTLTKSQKRVIKKNRDTLIYIQKPSMTQEHLDLYNRYHKFKSETSAWKYTPINPQLYYENFVDGAHDFGKEILYFIDGKLVGVDLVDICEDGISAIYFYYDPDYAKYSLGTYSLLMQIQFAKQMGLEWIYLGYWVEGCRSFAYKTNFKPIEVLEGFPPLTQEPKWQPLKNENLHD
ncbi:arginyltransferase [Hydrogenimonas cancrithermarum]|uniref:Aspartate/glutamate leucyltransferase n=1 Tax=Hydrogenimonas cancrithermarum TaxID=2993563 RepID=A0ABM8FNS0_9BACT|nr:arginyltransferase [Hydrogenimonas cancrithermarum]BDY13243.1 putative arginyl-tRNA--protein transferase [Hydrogenimonas cancrithermarum]